MVLNRIFILWLIVAMGSLITSCSEDDALETQDFTPGEENAEFRRGGDRGGGQGGDQDGPQGDDPRDPRETQDASVVMAWNDLFLELDRYATGMRPNATARALAYIHLAAYETAVPGLSGFESNEDHIRGLRIRGNIDRRDLDLNLALNAAYSKVLDHFLINLPDNLRSNIGTLEQNLHELYLQNAPGNSVDNSLEWGMSVAEQIIEFSQTDGEAEEQILSPQPLSYEPPTGEGYWTYSAEPERALFPYWESVRTFVISPDETSTVPPKEYSEDENSPYYAEMLEVYNANNDAREEDGEQLWIAEFWSDDVENLMMSPPGRQISIANQLIDQYNLDLETSLHLLVKLGFSLNDAAVATWKYKYEYMVMRPSVFIQDFIDPSYQTNLYRLIPWPNPTFPGYPSGHSCFASAAAGVFIDFFGSITNFTDRTHEGRTEFRGMPRQFDSFEEMAAENGYSRLPLGVHIKMDCDEGLRLGYEISDAVNRYQLRRRRA